MAVERIAALQVAVAHIAVDDSIIVKVALVCDSEFQVSVLASHKFAVGSEFGAEYSLRCFSHLKLLCIDKFFALVACCYPYIHVANFQCADSNLHFHCLASCNRNVAVASRSCFFHRIVADEIVDRTFIVKVALVCDSEFQESVIASYKFAVGSEFGAEYSLRCFSHLKLLCIDKFFALVACCYPYIHVANFQCADSNLHFHCLASCNRNVAVASRSCFFHRIVADEIVDRTFIVKVALVCDSEFQESVIASYKFAVGSEFGAEYSLRCFSHLELLCGDEILAFVVGCYPYIHVANFQCADSNLHFHCLASCNRNVAVASRSCFFHRIVADEIVDRTFIVKVALVCDSEFQESVIASYKFAVGSEFGAEYSLRCFSHLELLCGDEILAFVVGCYPYIHVANFQCSDSKFQLNSLSCRNRKLVVVDRLAALLGCVAYEAVDNTLIVKVALVCDSEFQESVIASYKFAVGSEFGAEYSLRCFSHLELLCGDEILAFVVGCYPYIHVANFQCSDSKFQLNSLSCRNRKLVVVDRLAALLGCVAYEAVDNTLIVKVALVCNSEFQESVIACHKFAIGSEFSTEYSLWGFSHLELLCGDEFLALVASHNPYVEVALLLRSHGDLSCKRAASCYFHREVARWCIGFSVC